MVRGSKYLLSSTCLTVVLLCAAPVAFANPVDGTVAVGQATISQAGKKLDVHQQSDKAVIDWRGFDIDADEHTQFYQPSASAIALNRVNSTSASNINGKLTANGNVIIVNQNGVMFGAGARVDVNGLVVTTADTDNNHFMNSNGKISFDKKGKSNAAIINNGQITIKEAGLAGFVAPNVMNNGVISAKLGRVHLASGDTATVDMYGDGLMEVAVSDDVKSQLVANHGVIDADGGTIALTAAAGRNIVNSLITNSGILKAQSVGVRNGKIIIAAMGSNAVAHNIATDKGMKTGESTVLISGVLDVSGRKMGERGGKILVTGDNVALLDGTLLDASGHTGKSGTTLGMSVSARREESAGGEILIGGDYLGRGDTSTAKNLYVDAGVLVLNDALFSGDAGRTIFWSDGTTQFYGNVYARALGDRAVNADTWQATAGGNAGDGGFLETSGHEHLNAEGYADLTSSSGMRGTYFLDPTDITIYGNVDPNFVSTDSSINLAANLKLWLDASDTTNVNLTYNSLGTTATGTSGTNTITVSANTGLTVGARIRLGAAGSVTAASTLGADTYTITNISGTTITLSSNLTTNYTGSGVYQGYVSQLSDKSGQTNHATQGTANAMPLWVSNGMNNNGLVTFDGNNSGSGDFLQITTLTLSNFSAFFGLINNENIADSGGAAYGTLLATAGNSGLYIYRNLATYYNSTTFSMTLPQNTPSLFDITSNTGLSTGYFNGATSNTLSTPASFGAQYIGGYNSIHDNFNGSLSNVIVYSTALSTNSRNLVEQYQSAKWEIALTPPGTGATEVAKATASDGYSVFTTRYLERLSQSANVSLQATNNITLDLKGDTLNFATSGRSLTLNAGNQITTASTGTITTNNGAISLTGTNGILFNHAFNLNSAGGNITLASPTTLGADLAINAGAGTVNFNNTVNGAYNLTATAGAFNFLSSMGRTTALGAVSLTSTNALTLPTIFASSISATTTSGNISGVGGLVTNGGAINLNAANDLDLGRMGIISNNGNVTLASGRDTLLSNAISTGTGDFSVTAVRDIFVTAFDLASGLVGQWGFDENNGTNANDSTANNNDGTITNGASWNSNDPYGLSSNYSLSFDGVNDYVDVGNPAALSFGSTSFSMSTWINTTQSATAGKYRYILGNGAIADESGYGLILDGDNGNKAAFQVRLGGSYVTVASNSTVNDGLWHLITVTRDAATNTSSIYVDGVFGGSSIQAIGNYTPSQRFSIGGKYSSGGWLTNGDFYGRIYTGGIDDVRVYNTALTSTQVSQLYAPQVDWNTGTTSFTAGGDVTLDLKGKTMALASGKSMTMNAGDSISNTSAGIITTSQSAGSGGNINMTTSGVGIINLDGSFTLNPSGALSLTTAGGNVTLGHALTAGNGAVTINAGTGTFTSGSTIATDVNTLSITANDVVLGGNLSGTGALTIKPYTASTIMNVNGSAGGLNLSTTELNYINNAAWSNITFGSTSDTGNKNIGAYSNWAAPVSFLSSNNNGTTINVNGAQSTTGATSWSAQGRAINVYAGITTNGGNINLAGITTISAALNAGAGNISITDDINNFGGGGILLNSGANLSGYDVNIHSTRGDFGAQIRVNSGSQINGSHSVTLQDDSTRQSDDGHNGVVLNSGATITTPTLNILASPINYAGTTLNVSSMQTWNGGTINLKSNFILPTSNFSMTQNIGFNISSGVTFTTQNQNFTGTGQIGIYGTLNAGTGNITFNMAKGVSTTDAFVLGNGGNLTGYDIYLHSGGGTGLEIALNSGSQINGSHSVIIQEDSGRTGYDGYNGITLNSGATITTPVLTLQTGGSAINYNGATLAVSGLTSFINAGNSSSQLININNALSVGDLLIKNNYAPTLNAGITSNGTLTLKPYTSSNTIGINGSAGTLAISNAILNNISAGNLIIGDSSYSGLMRLTSLDLSARNYSLSLLNGSGGIQFDGGATALTLAANKNFSAATSSGSFTTSALASIITSGTGTITIDDPLSLGGNFSLSSGGIVTLGGTVNSSNATPRDFTVASSSGGITFGGALGGINPLGAVSLASASAMTTPAIISTSILARTTGTGSDITLGGNLNATATTGTAITLASADDFFNTSSYTLTNGAGSRWLVYSDRPSDNTLGSINGSFNRYNCTYAGGCGGSVTISGSGNGLIYSYQPILTVTPNVIASITYGDAAPLLNGYAYTLSGYLAGESSDTVTGTLNGNTNYAQGSNVGDYNINYASGSLASAMGYGFTYANNATAFSVAARSLVVTAAAKSKSYGAADPMLTYTLTSGSLYGSDAFTGALARTAGETVVGGPYAITQNNLTAGSNYTISYTGANLTITPHTLSIIAAAQSKTYGASDPSLTYTYGTLQNGDTASIFSGALARTPGENVGNYVISLGSLTANYNYIISYAANQLSINPALLTISANSASRVQGQPNPTFSVNYNGFKFADDASLVSNLSIQTTADNNSIVGHYAIVPSGAFASNYVIQYINGQLTVTSPAVMPNVATIPDTVIRVSQSPILINPHFQSPTSFWNEPLYPSSIIPDFQSSEDPKDLGHLNTASGNEFKPHQPACISLNQQPVGGNCGVGI